MKKIRTLILDEDIENINILNLLLNKHIKNIEVVGTATNAIDAISNINKQNPDLLFLEIKQENEDWFKILDKIGDFKGEIIFVSPFTDFAYKVMQHDIKGYLLKPFNVKDLVNAVNKAKDSLQLKQDQIKLNEKVKLEKVYPQIIPIPNIDKTDLIKIENILYCEADGRYTIFHLNNEQVKVASRNLGEYEKLLDPSTFFRIHHSYIVNINAVNSVSRYQGNYCYLTNNKTLPIAKRRVDSLNKFLSIKLD